MPAQTPDNMPGGSGDLHQLGTHLQQLQQSIGPGGEHERLFGQFERTFQEYTGSLIALMNDPLNRPTFFEEKYTSVYGLSLVRYFTLYISRGKLSEPSSQASSEGRTFNGVCILLSRLSESNHFMLTFYGDSDLIYSDRQKKDRLNNIFPSGQGKSFNSGVEWHFQITFIRGGSRILMRPLEANDLLNETVLFEERNQDGTTHPMRIRDLFFEGTKQAIDIMGANTASRGATLQELIAQMSIRQELSDVVNSPTSSAQPLTETRVREIAFEVVRDHPDIRRLEAEGVKKEELRKLVEVVIATHQPKKPRLWGRQAARKLSDAEIAAALNKYAGDNQDARAAIGQFIQDRVQTATEPERVLTAFLVLLGGFVPGAAKVVAVAQAVNILFSKKVVVEDAALDTES